MKRTIRADLDEMLDDREFEDHDALLAIAEEAGKHGVRTDIYAEGCDYIGVDDLDRITW